MKYPGISARKMRNIIKRRKKFLKNYLTAMRDPEIAALANAISASEYDAIWQSTAKMSPTKTRHTARISVDRNSFLHP
jgi:hypothetical protein